MYYLIYMSTAIKLFADDELKGILAKSVANNTRNNITGMLLYSQGYFVQVLEGEKKAVEKTFAKILDDPRHKGIIELTQGDIEARNFPDWTMGFRAISPSELVQFDSFIGAPNADSFRYGTHPALTIFKTFAKSNF